MPLATRKATCRPATLLPALLAALLLVPQQARAQHAQEPPRYSFALRGFPLDEALDRLVAQTQIDLFYEGRLVQSRRASCVIEGATPEDALRCILRDTGLDFVRYSSGLYVITEAVETAPLYGQLTGVVLDAETGQPLPNAHVLLAEGTLNTTSNDAGRFAFARLRPGRYVIVATHLGYRDGAAHVDVPPGGDAQTQLALSSEPLVVAPIVVDGLQWRLPSADLGAAFAEGADLQATPGLGVGALAGLSSMLGVRVNETTAAVHVQGGETGEHQLRLDGAPVFLPLSFASFLGPFSPFAIGRVTVHKAGFDADKGSHIAGVIDLQHDLSFERPRRLDVQMDPLSLNARVAFHRRPARGPEVRGLLAGRRSLWDYYRPDGVAGLLDAWNVPDPFLRAAFDPTNNSFVTSPPDGNPGIGFHDLHGAARVRFGLLRSLHTSFYWGVNRLGTDLLDEVDAPTPSALSRDRYRWQTGMAQSRYEVVVGSRLLASVGARASLSRLEHTFALPDTSAAGARASAASASAVTRPDDGNQMREVAIDGAFDYVLGRRHDVHGRLEAIHTHSRFTVLGTQRFPIRHTSGGWRLAGSLGDVISLGRGLTLDAGTRLTYLPSHGAVYAEPRAALRLDVSQSLVGPFSFKLAGGRYRQFINQYDVSSRSPASLLSSTRFWLLADQTVRPPSATHLSAEWLVRPSDGWSLRLEGFVKQQHHILAIDYASEAGEDAEASLQQGDFLQSSRGSVHGAGALVQRRFGPGRTEARYEYTQSRRTIDELFGGTLQTVPWNEPHRLELALDLVPLRGLTLLARWYSVWGRTWGFRQSYYDFMGAFAEINEQNIPDPFRQQWDKIQRQIEAHDLKHPDEHRLPPVHQLDLSAAYTRPIGGTRIQARVDVLNVMDRTNVAEWRLALHEGYYDFTDPLNSGILERTPRTLLPRLVSLALKVEL